MATRWRGSTKLEEQADSPAFDFNGDSNVCTRRWEGPYTTCLAARPQRGAILGEYPEFSVDKVTVKRKAGNIGTLEVVSIALPDDESVGGVETEKFEVDWVQMERPLIQHPVFYYDGDWTGWGAFNPFPGRSPGGAYFLTPDDLVALQYWEKCPDGALKGVGKYYTDPQKRLPSGGSTLGANAMKYVSKRLAGVEAYAMYHPVVRLTTLMFSEPDLGPCGELWTSEQLGDLGFEDLPQTDAGTDYVYQQTADKRSRTGRNGKWERIREWTGAEYWDTDLYPAHTS